MPKNVSQRGPTQEERRRRSANRPIGGGGTPQQISTKKKDEGYSNTRLQRVSGIIGIIMLVALLLSLVPACYYSQAGAAELPAGYSQVPAVSHLSVTSVHSLEKSVETPLTAALAGPAAASSGKLYLGATGRFTDENFLKYWLEHGGPSLLGLPSQS
jgi:hypothetical protein